MKVLISTLVAFMAVVSVEAGPLPVSIFENGEIEALNNLFNRAIKDPDKTDTPTQGTELRIIERENKWWPTSRVKPKSKWNRRSSLQVLGTVKKGKFIPTQVLLRWSALCSLDEAGKGPAIKRKFWAQLTHTHERWRFVRGYGYAPRGLNSIFPSIPANLKDLKFTAETLVRDIPFRILFSELAAKAVKVFSQK